MNNKKSQTAPPNLVEPLVIRFYDFMKAQDFKRGSFDQNNMTWEEVQEFFIDSQFMARQIMKEHEELKKFTAGFGKTELCTCKGCEIGRRIYGVQG